MAVKSTLGAALILGAALCAPLAAQDTGARTVVAVVNGTEITLGHLIAARAGLPAEYQSLPDEVIFDGLLDQMIQQAVIEQSLEGKLTLREELALANERRAAMSAILVRQLADRSISEEAVQAAYEARFAEFTPQTEYHASHILVDSQELAQTLKTRIEAGEDFAALATQNSTDGSAAGGGDLGWFGLGQMVAPFEEAVVAAEVGKVAGPVQTQFGYHLVLVTETRNSARPALADVRAEIEMQLAQEAVLAHIDALVAAATVERTEVQIDPALLLNTDLLNE
ncbi:MAG: peptidylprolyl isomerase [Paracoccaceae bacterium]